MDLDQALGEFDRTETNLRRLMRVNEELNALIPEGISFPGNSPEALRYNDLRRSFAELAAELPSVGGLRIDVEPLSLDDIAQQRMDAEAVSEPQILVSLTQELAAPAEAIAAYRHRFVAARRRLVRGRIQELVGEVDGLLPALVKRHESGAQSVADDGDWQRLVAAVSEIRRLLADRATGPARWGDLSRHLSFALGVDLHDIANHDWPSVREDIDHKVYAEDEPLPVRVTDLDAVVATRPSGPVTTRLAWRTLKDDDFERLVFNLFGDAPGYHNPEWLTNTNAPDRGRRPFGGALARRCPQRNEVRKGDRAMQALDFEIHWSDGGERRGHEGAAVDHASL